MVSAMDLGLRLYLWIQMLFITKSLKLMQWRATHFATEFGLLRFRRLEVFTASIREVEPA